VGSSPPLPSIHAKNQKKSFFSEEKKQKTFIPRSFTQKPGGTSNLPPR
jgi:hypothetical protein